jgi:hypothetical protein
MNSNRKQSKTLRNAEMYRITDYKFEDEISKLNHLKVDL